MFSQTFLGSHFSLQFVGTEDVGPISIDSIKKEFSLMGEYQEELAGVSKRVGGLKSILAESKKGSLSGLTKMVKKHPEKVNNQDKKLKRTALHYAALRNKLEYVKVLLSHGADVNIFDDGGAIPLHFAAHHANKEMLELLLSKNSFRDKKATSHSWEGSLTPLEIIKCTSSRHDLTVPEYTSLCFKLIITDPEKKNVILIRHAESITNAYAHRKYRLTIVRDPPLTDKGLGQVSTIYDNSQLWQYSIHIDLIITSPAFRTLQTCLAIFGDISVQKNIPIITDHRITEHVTDLSNIGTRKSNLIKTFTHPNLTFDSLPEIWWYEGDYPEPVDIFQARVKTFMEGLALRKEKMIICVTHCATIRVMAGLDHNVRNCEPVILHP